MNLIPCSNFERSGNDEDFKLGETLIRQGKVGCLILAGGQGTRLGADVPKGTISIDGRSLFQVFCERAKECSSPLCIMTSELNHAQTVAFFETSQFFGLDPSQVAFFKQGMLPLLDDSGNQLLERPGKIAEGPDGNGHALRLFYETGIWQQWQNAGIEYLNIIFVDNVLADPFDPEFIGFTKRKGVDAALKAVERRSPEEKMGALAEKNGKLKVIEYFELEQGGPTFTLSSTGMFCISMACIPGLAVVEFPLHFARKTAQIWVENAQKTVSVLKRERFIFDLLDHVHSSAVLVCPREKIHAPLKNATGENSLETVRQALDGLLR